MTNAVPPTATKTVGYTDAAQTLGTLEDFHIEATEVERIETLFTAIPRQEFVPRKTEPRDISIITSFIDSETKKIYPNVDPGKIYEKSCFSLVLTDQVEVGRVVAHASFTDTPMDPKINIDGKRWRNNVKLEGMNAMNTLFMNLFAYSNEYPADNCLLELITNVFQSCHPISYIVQECPDLEYSGQFGFTHMVREIQFSPKPKLQKKLIIYDKDILFPHVHLREGREHDLDDLAPLLTLDTKEMEDHFNKSYLSDLIAMTERNNQSVVGEFDGEAIGIVAVTTDVDYALLNKHFYLEPFHGLFKPYEGDEVRLEPTPSRLLETANDTRVQDNYIQTPTKAKVYRKEKGSLEEFGSDLSLGESSSSSILSGIGYDYIDDSDTPHDTAGSTGITREQSEMTVEVEFKDMFDRHGHVLKADPSALLIERVRTGSILHTFVHKPAYRRESEDYGGELAKSESAQFALLEDVELIFESMEQQGLTLDKAKLGQNSIKTLEQASDMINHCIYSYLHRTLIDESLLPMEDLNEPTPSQYFGIPNAVALQLLAMEKRYEMRVMDLIQGAFLSFPNREYCILTTPLSVKELPWMRFFVRVTPRKDSLYPRALLLIHRCIFTAKPRVRKAKIADYDNILLLIESLYDKDKIRRDLEESLGADNNPHCFSSYVAEVMHKDEYVIIGLTILSTDPNASYYQINYDLDHYTYYDCHDPEDHAYVHHYVLSPIFQLFSKTFTKEVMRLMKKDCLYHTIPPTGIYDREAEHQTILNNLEDWIPLAPRKRIDYSPLNLTDIYDEERQPTEENQDYSFPQAIFHYAKKFTFEPKNAVTPRIVFIGASDTAMCCIQKLVSCAHLNFKNVTIISPNGIPGLQGVDAIRNMFFVRSGGISLSMKHDEEWHQRIGLKALVNVVYGTVTRLFRDLKVVIVNRTRVVPYDILVITSGKQFIRPDCPVPEITDENFKKFKESTKQQIPLGVLHRKSFYPRQFNRFTLKPKNLFVINCDIDAVMALNYLRSFIPFEHKRHIIIHGACLEAYCCIRALLKLGIAQKRIVIITTPGDEMSWEKTHGYRDTSKLRDVVSDTLKSLGVRVIQNYEFKKWYVNSTTGILNRVYFYSPTAGVPHMSIACFAYFAYCIRRVGDDIASACTEAFLSYNNGVIINNGFQTSDANIYAAGHCTVYEKRLCAEQFNHSFFSSEEVGNVLADILLKRIDPTTNEYKVNIVDPAVPCLPPLLTDPQVRFAQLPGEWYYMHMSRPGWLPGCCQEDCKCKECECGTEIVTGSTNKKEDPQQKYFRLWLNSFHRVEALECFSKTAFAPGNLASLYGHHETLLNKLLENISKGQVIDLYAHFGQPWIGALCLDRWFDFRMELQDLYAEYDIGQDIKISHFIRDYLDNLDNEEALKVDPNIIRRIFDTTGLKAAVESKFLDFLKYNRSVLPMYARPDFVEEIFEERKSSTLYLPYNPQF